jgi:hypothetical protein
MISLSLFEIGFEAHSGYCVKAFLADGLEGAIVVYSMQKLTFQRGNHDKLQHAWWREART